MGQPANRRALLLSILAIGLLVTSPVALVLAIVSVRRTETPVEVVTGDQEIVTRDAKIGNYLPAALDNDRVELAIPEGWKHFGRDSGRYLVKLARTKGSMPSIEFTVDPRGLEGMQTVTEDNLREFAELVSQQMDKSALLEPVIPMIIGKTPCARYVKKVVLKKSDGKRVSAELQSLKILRGGRLYTIDLTVLPKTMQKEQGAAYSVCASLRFCKMAEASTLPTNAAEQPAAADAKETRGAKDS